MTDFTHTDQNNGIDYDYSQEETPYVVRKRKGLVLRIDDFTQTGYAIVEIEEPPQTDDCQVLLSKFDSISVVGGGKPHWKVPPYLLPDDLEVGDRLTSEKMVDTLRESVDDLFFELAGFDLDDG